MATCWWRQRSQGSRSRSGSERGTLGSWFPNEVEPAPKVSALTLWQFQLPSLRRRQLASVVCVSWVACGYVVQLLLLPQLVEWMNEWLVDWLTECRKWSGLSPDSGLEQLHFDWNSCENYWDTFPPATTSILLESLSPQSPEPFHSKPCTFYRSSKRRTLAIILSTTVKQMSVVVALSRRYAPGDICRIVASKKIGLSAATETLRLHPYLWHLWHRSLCVQGKKRVPTFPICENIALSSIGIHFRCRLGFWVVGFWFSVFPLLVFWWGGLRAKFAYLRSGRLRPN